MKRFLYLIASYSILMTYEASAYQAPPYDEMRDAYGDVIYQFHSPRDRAITNEIQQKIRDDYYLAPYADKVNINTIRGVVSVSGEINSDQARLSIISKAQRTSGVTRVVDNLQVVHLMPGYAD